MPETSTIPSCPLVGECLWECPWDETTDSILTFVRDRHYVHQSEVVLSIFYLWWITRGAVPQGRLENICGY
jgi:hypothetical protein